jgi:ribonuclease P protein component
LGEDFPKSHRLLTRQDFVRVQDQGRKVSVGPFLALALPNRLLLTRLGITVSSKVGNAVTRARIRRQVREWFRRQRGAMPAGLDVVLIARGSAADSSSLALGKALSGIAQKLAGGGA